MENLETNTESKKQPSRFKSFILSILGAKGGQSDKAKKNAAKKRRTKANGPKRKNRQNTKVKIRPSEVHKYQD